jgi:hypothetical protein
MLYIKKKLYNIQVRSFHKIWDSYNDKCTLERNMEITGFSVFTFNNKT